MLNALRYCVEFLEVTVRRRFEQDCVAALDSPLYYCRL